MAETGPVFRIDVLGQEPAEIVQRPPMGFAYGPSRAFKQHYREILVDPGQRKEVFQGTAERVVTIRLHHRVRDFHAADFHDTDRCRTERRARLSGIR